MHFELRTVCHIVLPISLSVKSTPSILIQRALSIFGSHTDWIRAGIRIGSFDIWTEMKYARDDKTRHVLTSDMFRGMTMMDGNFLSWKRPLEYFQSITMRFTSFSLPHQGLQQHHRFPNSNGTLVRLVLLNMQILTNSRAKPWPKGFFLPTINQDISLVLIERQMAARLHALCQLEQEPVFH